MSDIEIQDIPEDELGPAMRRCSAIERRFVIACVTIGSGNWSRAAAMAGYKANANNLKVQGFRVSQKQTVREAILEMAAAHLASHATTAAATVLDIMEDPKTDKKTRLRAAEMIMDRVGMHSKTEHKVQVEHELGNRASMIALLKQKVEANPAMLESLPEPVRLLLNPPKVVEHEPAPLADLLDPELADLA
jgi:hypothetical protein